MALFQSNWGKGIKQAPVSREAGGVVCEKYTFTITADMAAGDILELGILPAYHTVVDAVLILPELGSATYDVGIMSGTVGSPDSARTSGDQYFDGVADATVHRLTLPGAFTVAAFDVDRSIGLKAVGAGITAASQVVTLVLFTAQ
jgi:hypothetical protein